MVMFPNESCDMLQLFYGKPYNHEAKIYITALRPSHVRVVTSEEFYADWKPWRVTVVVDKNNIITRISQECVLSEPTFVETNK